MGRRSYLRNNELANLKNNSNATKETIPLLPSFSDADSLLSICSNSFCNFNEVDLISHFRHFKDHSRINIDLSTPLDEYLRLWEKNRENTDQRYLYLKQNEVLLEVMSRYVIEFLKNVPGVKDMEKTKFWRAFFRSVSLFPTILLAQNILVLDEQCCTTNLRCFSVKTSIKTLEATLGSKTLIGLKEANNYIIQIKPSFEEIMFIYIFSFLNYEMKDDSVRNQTIERFSLAFTRYMENNYGKDSVCRMQKVINLMSYLFQLNITNYKPDEKLSKYVETHCESQLVKVIYKAESIENFIIHQQFV